MFSEIDTGHAVSFPEFVNILHKNKSSFSKINADTAFRFCFPCFFTCLTNSTRFLYRMHVFFHSGSETVRKEKAFGNRTGTIDAKIWDPNSMGIDEFEALDYVDISGDITVFNGALQVSIKRARKAGEGEYNPADYLPTSRYDIDTMYQELLSWIGTVKNQYLSAILTYYFIQDQETVKRFRMSSAAKSVHHGFVDVVKCFEFVDSHRIRIPDFCIDRTGAVL